MRILNSLIVPENVKGGIFWDFQHRFCNKILKQLKVGPFRDMEIFSKKVSQKQKMSHSVEKSGKGGLFCFGMILFHIKGFGCVQKKILSTYHKVHSAQVD